MLCMAMFDALHVRFQQAATGLLVASVLALCVARPVMAHDLVEAPLAQTEPTIDVRHESITGRVHQVLVDDPAHGTSSRYVELQLDDGTLVPLRGDAAAALQDDARATVAGQRNGKWLEVDAALTLQRAIGNVPKANAEVEGTFAVLHADDFVHGKSTFIYQVREASGKVNRLRVAVAPAALAPGMQLRIVGRADADGASITPDRITILSRPTSSSEASGSVGKAAVANKVLVIMANLRNTAAPAFTSAQAQRVMTSNADSVANFFREAAE